MRKIFLKRILCLFKKMSCDDRVYAAYGGVYIAVSVLWLWLVDGVLPDRWDLVGTAIVLVGVAVIYFAPRNEMLF